jgi:ribosomal subunit interface protein
MGFRVSGKNMDVGDALRTRITERVNETLGKYFDGSAVGHATVSPEGFGYHTECVLHLSSGITIHVAGMATDAYQSADAAALHLEKRLRRYKRRLKDHHSSRSPMPDVSAAASYIIETPSDADADADESSGGEYSPVIIAESTTGLKALSVGAAVIDLDLSGAPVLVFRHAANGRVNVVYRRQDGNIGWIDPSAPGGSA